MNPLIAFMGLKAIVNALIIKKFWPKEEEVVSETLSVDSDNTLLEYRKIGDAAFSEIIDDLSGKKYWRYRNLNGHQQQFSRGSFSNMLEFITYVLPDHEEG